MGCRLKIQKLDLKKELFLIFDASTKEIQFIHIPKLQFLMIDGEGNPNSDESYQNAVECLYSVSYTLKFTYRERQDYAVMPLETLWWMDDMTEFSQANIDRWKWTAMIMQPDFISPAMVELAKMEAGKKKPLHALPFLHFRQWEEGFCAQVLHKGTYASEESTIERLHAAIAAKGYSLNGKHHEIYLNNPGRTAPDKLKTIIRQPVCRRD
jgi:hypothetical protein